MDDPRVRSSISWRLCCSAVTVALGLAVGCGDSGGDSEGASAGQTTATTAGASTVSGAASSSGATAETTAATTGATTTGGGSQGSTTMAVKFDVGDDPTETVDPSAGDEGCKKVDFLFIIDNSGSMLDEQENLIASFDGFIQSIQGTLMAQDYHVMVVDTDAESLAFNQISIGPDGVNCMPEPQCCLAVCFEGGPVVINPPPTECNDIPCDEFELPTGCDVTLGAGKVQDIAQEECGIAGGHRYMVDGQPMLNETFACVALVGAGGDGNERPMEAMMEGLGPLTAPAECNDGFLRDDAILVVTYISDEEDDDKSPGDPVAWKQYLVDAKGGDESAVVVLGLIGDNDTPGALCSEDGAEPAPRLRSFAESFEFGQWGSVCAPNYAPFFDEAVSVIDTACDLFEPPE